MREDTINKLKKVIVTKRFVNCYSGGFSRENRQGLEQFLLKLKETYKNIIYVDIDIRGFGRCENEEQEANVLLDSINRELNGKDLNDPPAQAISIANVLHKWSNSLDNQVLLVFHCLNNRDSENEKNILRSIRKTLRNREKISRYLGVLIISNFKVTRWELFPESNLDDRHVAFFEFESVDVG